LKVKHQSTLVLNDDAAALSFESRYERLRSCSRPPSICKRHAALLFSLYKPHLQTMISHARSGKLSGMVDAKERIGGGQKSLLLSRGDELCSDVTHRERFIFHQPSRRLLSEKKLEDYRWVQLNSVCESLSS
jgi:hypothetical protein